jgi:hypothetical protein
MEAADEIPRQLRLRDLGGVIICDFIDLRYERHRRELEGRLHANFQKDRAKTKVLRMSQFGIIELTRQRMRPSLKRSIYFDCPHCKGAGLVKTPESMSLDVMRRLAIAMNDLKVARVELTVCPDVNFYLQNRKRARIARLEEQFNKTVIVRADPSVALDEARLDLFDARDARVYLDELGMSPPTGVPGSQRPSRQGGGRFRSQGRGPRDDRNQRGQQQRPYRQPPRPLPDEPDEDKSDFDHVEEELDRRDEEMAGEEPLELPAPEEGAIVPSDAVSVEGEIVESQEVAPTDRPVRDQANEEGGHHRRRRRRGRRGRGGGNRAGYDQGPQGQEQAIGENASELDVEVPEESDESDDLSQGPPEPGNERLPVLADRQGEQYSSTDQDRPRRRRRRGGRGRRRGGSEQNSQTAGQPASGNQRTDSSSDTPRAKEAPAITPTGSADKHLVQDEPIAPQPAHRPRTYRDLDSIPDDYD